MTVRVGLIGAGVMGADHARVLAGSIDGATVGGVHDVDAKRAEAVGTHVYADPFVLIDDGDIDAVLVASSDPTHEQFVLAALATGKPVLCEKPLAPDVAGCLRIVDAELALGRRLVTVGFMRRYDPGYVELKRTLHAGEIGPAVLMHCVHRNATAPSTFTSNMLLTSSATHEIDISRWLFGDEIVAVTIHRPRASNRVGDTLQDPQLLIMELAGGVLVDVEVFVNAQYGYDVHCELVGEKGTAGASGSVTPDWRDRFAEAYRRELQDWVDGVAQGQARGASAWDGYVATAVARTAVSALDGGRKPVRLATKPVFYK
ncbi:MAG TPA: Gfo/Idh/MocA family oxidoreductase [Jatrophihabitantaceae bacterium]